MCGKSRLLTGERRVDERLITGFPPARRIFYIGVVQYSAPILYRRRGDAKIDVVIRAGRSYIKTCWSCFWSLIGAHPPSKNFFFANTRRSTSGAQPYARLCVCFDSLLTRSWWNTNSSCQVPGLHRVEVQRPISWSPVYIINSVFCARKVLLMAKQHIYKFRLVPRLSRRRAFWDSPNNFGSTEGLVGKIMYVFVAAGANNHCSLDRSSSTVSRPEAVGQRRYGLCQWKDLSTDGNFDNLEPDLLPRFYHYAKPFQENLRLASE